MRGTDTVFVACPKFGLFILNEAVPLVSSGGANTGWFNTLKASARKVNLNRSDKSKSFAAETSQSK
jgi:hypothetical protein